MILAQQQKSTCLTEHTAVPESFYFTNNTFFTRAFSWRSFEVFPPKVVGEKTRVARAAIARKLESGSSPLETHFRVPDCSQPIRFSTQLNSDLSLILCANWNALAVNLL